MVLFEPISAEDFPCYWKYSIESFTRDMKQAGFLKENITYEEAEKDMRKFLPEGLSTKGHRIMQIVEKGEVVGTIWYEVRERVVKEVYLWDIFINENRRRQGYGKESMTELVKMATKEGAKRIQLNVFGFNAAAKNLYFKMGFQDKAITMMKYL